MLHDYHRGAIHVVTADENSLFNFRFCNLALGFVFGFLIQIATTFLVETSIARHEDFIKKNVVALSLALTAITFLSSAFVFALLWSLLLLWTRRLCHGALPEQSHRLKRLYLCLACSLFLGLIGGIDVAWIVTDILLGLRQDITYLMLSSVLSIAACFVVLSTMETDNEPSQEKDSDYAPFDPLLTV
jgi:hypothetical protein